jgi:hypothetical protein
MGLLGRLFNNGKEVEPGAPAASTQFHESEPDSQDPRGSRNAPRRELVQVVLRDTMRKHGIPSDWIECRILSSVSRSGRTGLHVNFVVRQAHDRMLAYVFAFQQSYERELARYEPRARDWLLSLGWEFAGFDPAQMPQPGTWAHGGPAPLVDANWKPSGSGFGALEAGREATSSPEEDDLQQDLNALFAIRDAALADTTRQGASEPPDFQPTQPGEDPEPPRR